MAGNTQFSTAIPDDEELPLEDDIVEEPELTPEEKRLAEIEAEAHRAGWRPKEEYRGPPGGWRTAEEFLKRGQDILPMVRKDLLRERERGTKMEEEIRALRLTVDEQKAAMDDLLRMARTADERGYKRGIEELKKQRREAASTGDAAAVVAITEQIEEVEEARAAAIVPVAPKAPAAPAPEPKAKVDPAVIRFVDENPWFNSDNILHRAMEAEHVALLEEAPGLSLEENLERAKQTVMARFPKKFGLSESPEEEPPVTNPTRRTTVSAPTVPAAGGRKAVTGIASIEDPQERAMAQMAYARTKRQIPDITEAEWFAVYQNPKADIMDIRNAAKQRKK